MFYRKAGLNVITQFTVLCITILNFFVNVFELLNLSSYGNYSSCYFIFNFHDIFEMLSIFFFFFFFSVSVYSTEASWVHKALNQFAMISYIAKTGNWSEIKIKTNFDSESNFFGKTALTVQPLAV